MHSWKQLRGEIASATGHNFERLALPLLRLYWPDLIRPPERDELDRAGVDLVAGISGTKLGCAVQCKGFYASERLDQSNYRQIRESIDTFIASAFRCREYVLFHNRDSRDTALKQKIKEDLRRIVVAGKATRTRLWDRQTFLRDLRKKLREQLRARIAEQSDLTLKNMAALFHFGEIYLPAVPVSEQRLLLRRGELPMLEEVEAPTLREPAKLVSSPRRDRWTLLMGLYGTGKSSAALHAASAGGRMLIYARCGDMQNRDGGVGTNVLMETILDSLSLFDEFDADARARLLRLSGTLMRALLIDKDNDSMLILDGLDENRSYSTPRGVMTLSSAISELRCPILLTTREEHFYATFANYDGLLADHSVKGGTRRAARVFRLEPWDDAQVSGFLALVIARIDQPPATLLQLQRDVLSGTLARSRLELLRHPLFLQMIAELTAGGEDWGENAAEVLGRWTAFKMWRDLRVDRALPAEVHDQSDYVHAMGAAMEDIAGAMTEELKGDIVLTETISAARAVAAVSKAFPGQAQDVTTATSASLLVSLTPSPLVERRLKFSHRAFQEYYLARYVLREGLDVAGYPDEIRMLHSELTGLQAKWSRGPTGTEGAN